MSEPESGVLDQLYLSWQPGDGPRLIASSLRSRPLEMDFERRLPGLVQVLVDRPADPEYLYTLFTGNIALLMRLHTVEKPVSRRHAHVLLGHLGVLDPHTALAAMRGMDWLESEPDLSSPMHQVPATAIRNRGWRFVTPQQSALEDHVVKLLREQYPSPSAPLTIVGTRPDDKILMLQALLQVYAEPLQNGRAWTFSTHESLSTAPDRLPEFVLASRWPHFNSPLMQGRLVFDATSKFPATRTDSSVDDHGSSPPAVAPRTPPSTVFVSYARQDETSVAALITDLRAAQLPVWFDQEIETGQQWWDRIVAQIQDAGALLHVVSPASLASEPCRLERDYAEALGIPVVPVLVHEADLRSSPYGVRQVIDYRRADRRQVARMIADVMRAVQRRGPLPEVPPEPPPAPFHFLLVLAGDLRAARLSREEQFRLYEEIIGHRRTAHDPSALRRLDELLGELADHPDALHIIVSLAQQALKDPGE